ncbi:UBC-like protein [Eremomyces bilateralis CBS 781.70]|uniref:UBC-like protein n=1 Tax=Eremomyces bilateralis CBS 781.70 TaxID=1392243 RepID=A0A6G1GB50_9PEZI|nr:UBC-like protein [Eremomyces bilateralis CBS 781.70]KAF1815327.1 UBC-like protein [Eremomyces bilateralis CBS 781.70]
MASGRSATPTKRLLNELQSYQNDPNESLVQLGPVSDDKLTHWTAVMRGVEGTAYEYGLWQLDIQVPSGYPHSPPEVKFITPICHPNVDFKTGEICLDLLKTAWTPAYTITTTLTSIHQLLTSAEPDSPLNLDIAQLFREGDFVGAESLIRYYSDLYRYNGP